MGLLYLISFVVNEIVMYGCTDVRMYGYVYTNKQLFFFSPEIVTAFIVSALSGKR